MKHFKLLVALALTALGTTLPAWALDAEDITPDVRCLVVGFYLSRSADPAQQSAGRMLSVYFMGKITGRRPSADLEELLFTQVELLAGTNLQPEAQRCGGELTEVGGKMKEVGAALMRRAKEMQKADAPPAGRAAIAPVRSLPS